MNKECYKCGSIYHDQDMMLKTVTDKIVCMSCVTALGGSTSDVDAPTKRGRLNRRTMTGSIPMMHQLADLAGIPRGLFKRMVLVLEPDCTPILHTEGMLYEPKTDLKTELSGDGDAIKHVPDSPVVVDTTSMQNERWRTSEITSDADARRNDT